MISTTKYYPSQKPNVGFTHSMCHPNSKKLLSDLLENHDVKIIAEIGCFVGSGCNFLMSLKNDLSIVAIDLWDNQILIDILKNDKQMTMSHRPAILKLIDNLEKYPLYEAFLENTWEYKDHILPLKMDSLDGLNKMKELDITPDIIFIDSSHAYENTKKEILLSLELFPNAIICGDDYIDLYDGVIRAVNEVANNFNYPLKIIGGAWLLNK